MDWEVVFWLVALLGAGVFTLRAIVEPEDVYYKGRMDKIGGKGGRQFTHLPGCQ